MLYWNTANIFKALGGVSGVLKAVSEASGEPAPAKGAVAVWKSRGQIPAAWLPAVMKSLLSEDTPELALEDIFTTTPPVTRPPAADDALTPEDVGL